MATLPEGCTVRKVGNSLKVVPMRKRRVVIAKKEKIQMEEYPTNYYHKCGHQARFTAITPENQERILEAYEKAKDRDCSTCSIELKEYGFYPIKDRDLVELQGSEKQVAWSVKIRKDFLDYANIRIKDGKRRGATEDDVSRMRRYFIAIFNQQTQAKWWIDHRYDTLKIFDPAWQEMIANEQQ